MTKKDYVKFANEFRKMNQIAGTDNKSFDEGYKCAVNMLIESATEIFASDNPNFNRERFLKACGYTSN